MSALMIAAWVGWAGPAAAQGTSEGFGCTIDAVPDGPGRDIMLRASQDNTNLYGAVGTLERVVLPTMDTAPGMALMTLEQHVLAGAARVPAVGSGDCSLWMLDAPLDLTSSSFGLAWSNNDVGVFYNASVTHVQAYGGGAWRPVGATLIGLSSVYYGIVAPFFPGGSKEYEAEVVTWDWVAGAQVTPGSLALRAGYLGSKGGFFQASEEKTGAFASVAANESFAELPYLKGGLSKAKIPGLYEKIGRTSVFARRMDFLTAPASGSEDAGQSLGTAHIAQEGIAEVLDFMAAYAWEPTPLLHELRIGLRTRGFPTTIRETDGPQFRAIGGMVRMPTDPSLGVEGGPRFSGAAELVADSRSRKNLSRLIVSAKMNDPEVLAMFPYAEDAVDIHFLLQVGQEVSK